MKETTINVSDNRLIRYIEDNNGYMHTYTINEGFLESNDLNKSYSLSMYDDYCFSAFTLDNTINRISFSFDIDHPLYIPLLHLLNGDKEVIIDDDNTNELNKKYLKVYIENNIIYLDFVNELHNDEYLEMFNVFVKNITYDLRSKIDSYGLDTKDRLNIFFREAIKRINEEYHQITIEEYMLKKTLKKH